MTRRNITNKLLVYWAYSIVSWSRLSSTISWTIACDSIVLLWIVKRIGKLPPPPFHIDAISRGAPLISASIFLRTNLNSTLILHYRHIDLLLHYLIRVCAPFVSSSLRLIHFPSGAFTVSLRTHLQLECPWFIKRIRENVKVASLVSGSSLHYLRHYMGMNLGKGVRIG